MKRVLDINTQSIKLGDLILTERVIKLHSGLSALYFIKAVVSSILTHPVNKVYMGGDNLRLSVNCLYGYVPENFELSHR